MMAHDHVNVAVDGSATKGVGPVPARQLEDGSWLLLHSPLYALQLAAGDTIRIVDNETGTFDVLAHGGNVVVQFYLSEQEWKDPQATARAASAITPGVVACGGRLEGQTRGLIVYTIPLEAGFSAIEAMFAEAVHAFPGAQWQYTNVYDARTGEPLRWWE